MICGENKLGKTIRMSQGPFRYFKLEDVSLNKNNIYWYDDDLGTYVLPMIAPTLFMVWEDD